MNIAVLGPGERAIGYTTQRILEEAKKEFKKVNLVPILNVKLKIDKKMDAVFDGKSLNKYDYILPRIDSKRAAMGYSVMKFLDSMGANKPYPAETVLMAHNKFLTLERLTLNNIPVPKTFLTGSKKSAKEIIKKEHLPIILKLLSGFGGQGVMVMESKEAAETAIDTLKILKQEILLEEYVENPGEDVRGVVAGDDVIASFKRIAASGEKKTNLHAGGRSQTVKLTSDMEDLILKSAEAVKAKICAVDMIVNGDNMYVIEVNINPGLEGIEKTTNINVAQRIVSYVKDQLKK